MAPNDELAAIQAALRLQPQSSRGEVVTEAELDAALGTSFRIEKYGTVDTTGATDSGTAVRAAIAAAYEAGGGTIEFPTGIIRIDSLPTLPNNGASPMPAQPPLAFVGQGSHRDGSINDANPTMPGGTVLDLRDSTGLAKIDTRGRGVLVIRDLTLTNLGTADTIPFVKHTGTTLHVDNIAVLGHKSKSGTSCDQDAFQHGSVSAVYAVNGSATSSYWAYGSTINAVYFNRIRRGIYALNGCNGLMATNLTFGNQCGADATAGAIHLDGTGDQATANQISNVILEAINYVHPIHLKNANNNTFRGIQIWDATGTMVTAILHETGCFDNFYEGYIPAAPKRLTGAGASFRTGGFMDVVLGGQGTIVRPQAAVPLEASVLLSVNRSLAEPVNPGAVVGQLTQHGSFAVTGSSAGVSMYNPTTLKRLSFFASGDFGVDTGNLNINGGPAAVDKVKIARGCLVIGYGTTAQRPNPNGSPGCHFFDLTLGKPIWTNNAGTWVDATGTPV